MRDSSNQDVFRFVIVTLDQHTAGPASRVRDRLTADFPGLEISIHAAAEWGENPAALADARQSIAQANIVVANLLFLEEHTAAILPDLIARRDACDAMVNVIADSDIVKLTRMGSLDMSAPASGAMKLLKSLRGSGKPSAQSGEKQMKTLRRLPKILRLIPGKAQDLRTWFLSMQYWLGGSDDNIEQMIRMLVSRYAIGHDWDAVKYRAPIEYPEVGVHHPDLPGHHISTDIADLPRPKTPWPRWAC